MKFNLSRQLFPLLFVLAISASSCNSNNTSTITSNCTFDITIDRSRGACDQMLTFTPSVNTTTSNSNLTFTTNSIPNHMVGLFGRVSGALNPNAISIQNSSYTITTNPVQTGKLTALLGSTGPSYQFGVLLNGIELDPVAAEPFPNNGNIMDPNVNWEWNLEALNAPLGLDCNNAHVQPSGKYHYHGKPTLYLETNFKY